MGPHMTLSHEPLHYAMHVATSEAALSVILVNSDKTLDSHTYIYTYILYIFWEV